MPLSRSLPSAPKPLAERALTRLRAVAEGLLRLATVKAGATAATAMMLGGCLAPQDDGIVEPLFQVNRPPIILESTAVASGKHGAYVELESVCPTWFEAVGEDRDIDDRVEFRWFVTDLNDSSGSGEGPIPFLVDAGVFTNTGSERRPPARIDFKEDQPINPLRNPGNYIVELMAFDGRLTGTARPGSVPEPEPIPGTDGGFNTRYSTSYAWTVKVVAGTLCSLDEEAAP